jgi:hypothetical protein
MINIGDEGEKFRGRIFVTLTDQVRYSAISFREGLFGSCSGFVLSPMLPNLPFMNTPPFSDLLDNNVSKTVSCRSTVNHSTEHEL